MKLPFYITFTDSVQWLPVVVQDHLGTEIWWFNLYLALELGGQQF